MVVDEKALKRCLKEAYRNSSFTVAVSDGRMMINSGYWMVIIDVDEVPSEILKEFAGWMRKIPGEGEAYRVCNSKEGPIIQKQLLQTALSPLDEMEARLIDAMGENPEALMRRTGIRLDNAQVWQNNKDMSVLMVDQRYETMLSSFKDIRRVGTGIHADDSESTAWILGMDNRGSAKERLDHLAKFRWVHE